jgi:hypothetical protein
VYVVAGTYLDDLPVVRVIGENESWVALAVRGLTFVATLRPLLRTLVLPPLPGTESREPSATRAT